MLVLIWPLAYNTVELVNWCDMEYALQLMVNESCLIVQCLFLKNQENYTDPAPHVKRLNERCIAHGEEVTSNQ